MIYPTIPYSYYHYLKMNRLLSSASILFIFISSFILTFLYAEAVEAGIVYSEPYNPLPSPVKISSRMITSDDDDSDEDTDDPSIVEESNNFALDFKTIVAGVVLEKFIVKKDFIIDPILGKFFPDIQPTSEFGKVQLAEIKCRARLLRLHRNARKYNIVPGRHCLLASYGPLDDELYRRLSFRGRKAIYPKQFGIVPLDPSLNPEYFSQIDFEFRCYRIIKAAFHIEDSVLLQVPLDKYCSALVDIEAVVKMSSMSHSFNFNSLTPVI